MFRTQLLGGLTISDSGSTIMFNTIPLHAFPIVINMFNNALLRSLTGVSTALITTSNHPINYEAVVSVIVV